MTAPALRVVTTGLQFPEGPVAMADGSVILVEIRSARLTRVAPDGSKTTVAQMIGGPNGAARGPDGKIYVCNNGGFNWMDDATYGTRPTGQATDYSGGRIERVDVATGRIETLYTECNGHPLRGPNDLVFDAHGGFYFTDLGKSRARDMDHGGVYYAKADGSSIVALGYPLITPNGIGLSPDGNTVYVAETRTARIWAFDLEAPGVAKRHPGLPHGGRFIAGLGGYQMFDSLKIDAAGNICVATLVTGAITVIAPDGRVLRQHLTGDPMTTNIAFGAANQKTAYLTLSGPGELVAMDWTNRDWSTPGLRLNHVI